MPAKTLRHELMPPFTQQLIQGISRSCRQPRPHSYLVDIPVGLGLRSNSSAEKTLGFHQQHIGVAQHRIIDWPVETVHSFPCSIDKFHKLSRADKLSA